jgi:4'-phosphopantetheinyl transferase
VDFVPASEIESADPRITWPLPPPEIALADDEVHVWCARLRRAEGDGSAGLTELSEEERAQSARFHFESDRQDFVARRSLLRAILGRYLKIEPSQVSLAHEERGKPRLSGPDGAARLHFNLSHSRNLALCAVGRFAPLGVDVEQLRPMPEMAEIAAMFASPQENALLRAAPPNKRLAVFFSFWTRKEAYLKATGEGIAGSLAQIDCSEAPPGWALLSLSPAPGFAAALAFPGGGARTLCWQWDGSWQSGR